ncbi:hypothetical protein ABEW32_03410 [Paenibacillus jamilae]|uniref:hypothetical protein n=1 Tax=Paenibacillus jamilae TaxID=114136 RepID=UPI003D26F4D3
MDNLAELYVGLFFMVFIIYPLKVFVRWLAGFLNYSNTMRSWITFIALTFIYLIFITQMASSADGIFRGIVSVTPIFLIYLVVDLQKNNPNSKLIKFIHHLAVRIIVSVLTFVLVLFFYSQRLHDYLFIKSLLIGIVYVCVILRRRTKKPRKNKIQENVIQSP